MHEPKDPWSVGAWMTPNPSTVAPDTWVRNAFFTMRKDGFRHLPVVEDGDLVGIVTDRDLRRPDISDDAEGWNDFYNLDEDYEVRDVMTADPRTVRSIDSVEDVLPVFIQHKYGALPVLNKNGELIGILTAHDLLRAFAELMEREGTALRRQP